MARPKKVIEKVEGVEETPKQEIKELLEKAKKEDLKVQGSFYDVDLLGDIIKSIATKHNREIDHITVKLEKGSLLIFEWHPGRIAGNQIKLIEKVEVK